MYADDSVLCGESEEDLRARRVAGAMRSLVNARSLQLDCVRVFHESLMAPVLMYGSETMPWSEKERSRIRTVQMDNLRGLLGIRRMDKVLTAQIKKLCRVTKGVDEKIDEDVLRCFGNVEREGERQD